MKTSLPNKTQASVLPSTEKTVAVSTKLRKQEPRGRDKHVRFRDKGMRRHVRISKFSMTTVIQG